jgi:hypothetical protein
MAENRNPAGMNPRNERMKILPHDDDGDIRIAGARLILPRKQISG